MAENQPDFTFVRDGRSLREWLPDLVAVDAAARCAAGDALQAMWFGISSVHVDIGALGMGTQREVAAHGERFKQQIRAAVQAPGFGAREFVRALIQYQLALKDDRSRRLGSPSEQKRRRLIEQIFDLDDDVSERAAQRHERWLRASQARARGTARKAFTRDESTGSPGIMSGVVFKSLGAILLVDQPGLRVMLADKDLHHEAASALAVIGPAAVDFAPYFLERLDAATAERPFREAYVLGSVGRDDPATIDGLLKRLRKGLPWIRAGAAEALSVAGPPLAGRIEVAIDLLLAASYEPDLLYAAIRALGSVGRESEVALARVLEVAAPRPPRLQAHDGFPEYKYDVVMYERSAALDALKHFTSFPARAVPALVEALDSFEEYDPDEFDFGEHARVCHALAAFGPAASPAVPRIVRYLAEEWPAQAAADRLWPKAMLRLLAAIGPAAREALPILEAWRLEHGPEDPNEPLDPDDFDDLDPAVLALRGMSPHS